MKICKIAVLGTGHLGKIHAKLWKNIPNAELVGVFDANDETAKTVATELNVRQFLTSDEAIQHADAVTIAASTTSHFELAKQCILAGKHCFIEKPITTTYSEALELIKLAEQKDVMIQVGHVERFNPALTALHGYSISPMFIEAHRLAQFKPRATDVSVILDLMIHDIDIALWLVKSPVLRVDANGVAVITETPDIANARITFENGCVANITASRISQKPMRKMRVFQKDAYFSMDFGNSTVEVFRLTDENSHSSGIPAIMLGNIEAGTKNKTIIFEQPPIEQTNAIQQEQFSFVRSILENIPIAVSAQDGAEALRIAELIAGMLENQKM